jgi:hypothetical protein
MCISDRPKIVKDFNKRTGIPDAGQIKGLAKAVWPNFYSKKPLSLFIVFSVIALLKNGRTTPARAVYAPLF